MDEFGKTIASAFIGALIGEIVKRSVDAIAERIKKASRGTGKHIKKL